MALRAQLGHRLCGKHVFILSPVCPMTAQALHGQVLVSFINYLWTDGMGRVLLPIVTLSAELDGRLLREQEHVVGSVR